MSQTLGETKWSYVITSSSQIKVQSTSHSYHLQFEVTGQIHAPAVLSVGKYPNVVTGWERRRKY